MPSFGRDFTDINKGVKWISLRRKEYQKKKWKRFGTKSKYLDTRFGPKNWRYCFIDDQNNLLDHNEVMLLIYESFKLHFQERKGELDVLINEIDNPIYTNYNADLNTNNDLVSINIIKIISLSLQKLIDELDIKNQSPSLENLHIFFQDNMKLLYQIQFYGPKIILSSTIRYQWDEFSIQSFITNNLIFQARFGVLEKEEDVSIGIFIRKDLKLGKGKTGAQISHSAVSLLFQPRFKLNSLIDRWKSSKDRNIKIWKIDGLKELLSLEKLCISYKINNALIQDAGHTQIDPGTSTCIAVGPLPSIWINILAEEVNGIIVQ